MRVNEGELVASTEPINVTLATWPPLLLQPPPLPALARLSHLPCQPTSVFGAPTDLRRQPPCHSAWCWSIPQTMSVVDISENSSWHENNGSSTSYVA